MDPLLSQGEIDALMKAVEGGQVSTPRGTRTQPAEAQAFDLTSPLRHLRWRMPTLDLINDRFARLMRVSLSNTLRRRVEVSAQERQTLVFEEYTNALPIPSCLSIIRMEPLQGVAIVLIDTGILYLMLDSFFGTMEMDPDKQRQRDFTPVEMRIISRIVKMICAEIEKAWRSVTPVTTAYVTTEINPHFVTALHGQALLINSVFKVEIEGVEGNIAIAFPHASLEPLRDKLSAGVASNELGLARIGMVRLWMHLSTVNVNTRVDLGKGTISLHELMELKTGDIIRLDTSPESEIILKVEGIPKAAGKPVVSHGMLALKITRRG